MGRIDSHPIKIEPIIYIRTLTHHFQYTVHRVGSLFFFREEYFVVVAATLLRALKLIATGAR